MNSINFRVNKIPHPGVPVAPAPNASNASRAEVPSMNASLVAESAACPVPSLWRTDPKQVRGVAVQPLLIGRGRLVERFEGEFFELIQSIFPERLVWLDYLSLHPQLKGEVVSAEDSDSFSDSVRRTASFLLNQRKFLSFAENLPARGSPVREIRIRAFVRRWETLLPVVAMVNRLETLPPERARRVLAGLTVQQRQIFDAFRAADPSQTVRGLLRGLTSNRDAFNFLVRRFTEILAQTAKERCTIPGVDAEFIAKLDALSPEDRVAVCGLVGEGDRPFFEALLTEKRAWTLERLHGCLGIHWTKETTWRLKAHLDDWLRDADELQARVRRDVGLTLEEWGQFESRLTDEECEVSGFYFRPLDQAASFLKPILSTDKKSFLVALVSIKFMDFLRDPEGYLRDASIGAIPSLHLTPEQKTALVERNVFDDVQLGVLDYLVRHGRLPERYHDLADRFGSSLKLIGHCARRMQLKILSQMNDFDFALARDFVRRRRAKGDAGAS